MAIPTADARAALSGMLTAGRDIRLVVLGGFAFDTVILSGAI
jgi:hypothetical protein